MRNLNEVADLLTKDQVEWFAERTNTTPSGLVTFSSYTVTKFKKLTGQPWMSNLDARMEMQYMFSKFA